MRSLSESNKLFGTLVMAGALSAGMAVAPVEAPVVGVPQAEARTQFFADPGVIQMRRGAYFVPEMKVFNGERFRVTAWSCTPWIQAKRMVVRNVLHDPLFGKPRYRKQQVAVWDVVYGYGTPQNHLNQPDRRWSFSRPRLPGKVVRSVMTCAARGWEYHPSNGSATLVRSVGTVIGPERIF